MSTLSSTPTAGHDNHVARLRDFVQSRDGRPALLGCLGALLITAGGLGAGSTRLQDPLLESLHLSWLRFGHGLVLSSVTLWLGVGLMLVAWIWLGRWVIQRRASTFGMIATTGFWLAPLLLSVPVFSRDIYSYLAQGALLRDGLDPYLVGPVDNPNALLDNVSPIWTITTAPYGPAFILIAKFITMLVGSDVVAGTMLLRLCMLPGLLLLIWAAPRIARHVGASGSAALWICVLNPLVIIHLMGGVHNEMLMVGLMMAGIALTLERHPVAGISVIAVGVAVKATAGLALPFMVWVWMRQLQDRRAGAQRPGDEPRRAGAQRPGDLPRRAGMGALRAFASAAAASVLIFVAVFAVLSGLAGVGLGWLTALAGSVKIINWLTVPTAAANLINVFGGLFVDVKFYAVLEVTRIVGIVIIAVALPVLWWRFRRDDREALTGIVWAMIVLVLFVPAALPWYYAWPLAAISALAQSRTAIAAIAGFSTWIMVVFKPDGSHGMYSWIQVAIATACALTAWYALHRSPGPAETVSTPEPARDAAPPEPDASAVRRSAER